MSTGSSIVRKIGDYLDDRGADLISKLDYELSSRIERSETNDEIIRFLCEVDTSLPLGYLLRRYIYKNHCVICEADGKYYYTLKDGTKVALSPIYTNIVTVTDADGITHSEAFFCDEQFTIPYTLETDLEKYVSVFLDIAIKYASTDPDAANDASKVELPFDKTEMRRLLRVTGACTRKKMFDISFALHMNSDATTEFLTRALAEQTYNFRNPDEIIAYFCQSTEQYNSYADYLRLCAQFKSISEAADAATLTQRDDYSRICATTIRETISTENELMSFLMANRHEFTGFSKRVYDQFIRYYSSLKKLLGIHVQGRPFDNDEQFARELVSFTPRYTHETVRNDRTIYSGEFMRISNKSTAKKPQTTTMAKEITENLPFRERLEDLVRKEKPVERKDLIFFFFHLFFIKLYREHQLEHPDKDFVFSTSQYKTFKEQCNNMLVECGMSPLYPANKFDKFILITLFADDPLEIFDYIFANSFFNEPEYIERPDSESSEADDE